MLKLLLPVFIALSAVCAAPIESDYINTPIDLSKFPPSFFGVPDYDLGEIVSRWNSSSKVNPEELGSYYQGDILDTRILHSRSSVSNAASRWPNGIVYYVINGPFSAAQLTMINRAFELYHENTCIKWIKRTNELNYVEITGENSGCWSNLGRILNRQQINLQPNGCLTYVGTAIHEMMHTLGFHHEQTRPDRDNYVRIKFENIEAGKSGNFNMDHAPSTTSFGTPYDYDSVMHYTPGSFSKNGYNTIEAIESGITMGQRQGFSQYDLAKLKLAYGCPV